MTELYNPCSSYTDEVKYGQTRRSVYYNRYFNKTDYTQNLSNRVDQAKKKLFVARNYVKSNMLYKFRFYDNLVVSRQNAYPYNTNASNIRFCIGMNFTNSTGFYSDRLQKYLSFMSSDADLNSLTISEMSKGSIYGLYPERITDTVIWSSSKFAKFCADYENSKVEFYFFEIDAMKKQFKIGKKNYNGQVTYYKTVNIPIIPAAKVPNFLDVVSKFKSNSKNVWYDSVGEYSVSLYDSALDEITLAVEFIPISLGVGEHTSDYIGTNIQTPYTGDGPDPTKIVVLEQKIKNAQSRGYFGIELTNPEPAYATMKQEGKLPTYENIDIKIRSKIADRGIHDLTTGTLYAPQRLLSHRLIDTLASDFTSVYQYGTDNSLVGTYSIEALGQRSKKTPFSLCQNTNNLSIIKINFEYDQSFSNTKEISNILIDYINKSYTNALGGSFKFELGEIYQLPTSWPSKLQEIPYWTEDDRDYNIYERMFDTNFYPESTIFADFNGFSDIKNDNPFVYNSFSDAAVEKIPGKPDSFNILYNQLNTENGQIETQKRQVKSLLPINTDSLIRITSQSQEFDPNTEEYVITARICKSPIFFKQTDYYTAGFAGTIGPFSRLDRPCFGAIESASLSLPNYVRQPSFYCSWSAYPNINYLFHVFVHELGHVLGSRHDNISSKTIMAPYVWNSKTNTPLTDQYLNLLWTDAFVNGSCGTVDADLRFWGFEGGLVFQKVNDCSNSISKCIQGYENSVYLRALLPSLPFVNIENNGNIQLYRDQQYKLYVYDTTNKKYKSVVNARGVPQKSTFLPGIPASLGKDETIIAGEKIGNVNLIILRNSVYGNIIVLQYQEYNDAWLLVPEETETYTPYDFEFYDLEIDYNLDLNNDGKIGLPDTGLPLYPSIDPNPIGSLTYIEQNKNVSLAYDSQGRLFANNTIIRGFDKLPIDYFATQNLTAVSAETVDGVDQLVFKNINDNSLVIYEMYPSPNDWLARSVDGPFGFNTAEYLDVEYNHNTDFNGDGLITKDNTTPATIVITKNLPEKFPHYVDPIDGKVFSIEVELKNQANFTIQESAINTFVWQYNTVGLENNDEWHTLVLDSYSKNTSSSFTYVPPNKSLNHTTYIRCVIYSGKITTEYPYGDILNISNVIETQLYPEEFVVRFKKGQLWADFVMPENLDAVMIEDMLDDEQKQKISAIVKFPYGNSNDFTDYFGYNKLKAYPILDFENPYTGRTASTIIANPIVNDKYDDRDLQALENYLNGLYPVQAFATIDESSKKSIITNNANQVGYSNFRAGYMVGAVCFPAIPKTMTYENNEPFKPTFGSNTILNIGSGEKFTFFVEPPDLCGDGGNGLRYSIYSPYPSYSYPTNAYVSLYNHYISGTFNESAELSDPGPYWDQRFYKTTPREDETEYGIKSYRDNIPGKWGFYHYFRNSYQLVASGYRYQVLQFNNLYEHPEVMGSGLSCNTRTISPTGCESSAFEDRISKLPPEQTFNYLWDEVKQKGIFINEYWTDNTIYPKNWQSGGWSQLSAPQPQDVGITDCYFYPDEPFGPKLSITNWAKSPVFIRADGTTVITERSENWCENLSENLIYKNYWYSSSDWGDYEPARELKFSSAVTGTDVQFGEMRIDLCGKMDRGDAYWEYVWYPTGVANDFITYTRSGRVFGLYEEIRDNRYSLCDNCVTKGPTTTCGYLEKKCVGGREKPCTTETDFDLYNNGDPWFNLYNENVGDPYEWIKQYRRGDICANLDWREVAENSLYKTSISLFPGFYKFEPGEKYRIIFAADESDKKGHLSAYHPLKENFSIFLPIPSGYDFSSASTNFNIMSEIDTNITCTGEARPIETLIPANERIQSFYIDNAYEIISSNVGLPIDSLDPGCIPNILSISDPDNRLNYWKPNSALSTLTYLVGDKNYIVRSKSTGYNLVFN